MQHELHITSSMKLHFVHSSLTTSSSTVIIFENPLTALINFFWFFFVLSFSFLKPKLKWDFSSTSWTCRGIEQALKLASQHRNLNWRCYDIWGRYPLIAPKNYASKSKTRLHSYEPFVLAVSNSLLKWRKEQQNNPLYVCFCHELH